MLFLKSWLEDYINLTNISNEELVRLITAKSSEVDEIIEILDVFGTKVIVGKIKNVKRHPSADNLQVFDILISVNGVDSVQIVSAAKNVREDLVVPVAMVGAKLPFFSVGVKKLRGIDSIGVCLGKDELGLENVESCGLWDLELETGMDLSGKIGVSICQIFPELLKSDCILDIKVLPDKIAAIGSHLGMAKELSIILPGGLNLLTNQGKGLLNQENIEILSNQIVESIEKSQIIANFEDTTNSYVNSFDLYQLESEDEIGFNLDTIHKMRLFKLGQNLVGGFTDLTNYLLLDVGQPSHVFSVQSVSSVPFPVNTGFVPTIKS